MIKSVTTRKGEAIKTPQFITTLLNHPLASLLWLPLRVWLGWQWVTASIHKFENPAWMQTGAALKGFWTAAVAIPEAGSAPIHYEWYRSFLQFMLNTGAYTWFAKLIPVGEFLVGIALILGLFTGLAAFMGGFMNFNFMMAGSASVNPMFFAISVLLVLAWRIAGYIGADYFLVPWFGGLWNKKGEKQPARSPKGAEA
jgi:thiosulfate dehydrogenase [quinone] large subunit